jgi:hypothetical protein
MKFTSSVSIGKTDSGPRREEGSSRTNLFAALVFAATLALAPVPTFAQHGGGGGGGGAHGGGGGGGSHGGGMSGGGSHASSGSSGSHSASAPAGSGAGHSATNTTASTGSSHWWNPFHGGSANSAGSNVGSTSDHVSSERFAGSNNTWQEPPAAGARGAGAANAVKGSATAPRAAIASPPHVPVPRRPIGVAPFYPFNPFFPYGGFGYGFGFGGLGFGYGAFGPCDPFWGGCYGFGYGGGGIGYGYYGGGYSSDNGYGTDLSYSGSQDNSPSQETNPSLYAAAPETSQGPQSATEGPAEKHVTAVLYFKDGSSYAVTNYWLADGKLHYITSYGGENAVDQKDLDLQRTVDENAAQGLTFTLHPGPVVSGGAMVVPQ